MSLRARVGRHARQGERQCQNFVRDQQTVINLLNHIPDEIGGRRIAGGLDGPIKSGICSDALYRAIMRFEIMNYPRLPNGFIEPDGAMLKDMEKLAAWGDAYFTKKL